MEIECTFTVEALDEAARLNRRWYYWPLTVWRNLLPVLYYAAFLVIGIQFVVRNVRGETHHFQRALVGLLVVLALVVVPLWYFLRLYRKARAEVAELGPQKFTFTDTGISSIDKNGCTSFVPWSQYAGFREGKGIFFLRIARSEAYRVIPKETFAQRDAERLRSLLLTRLPELPR